MFVICSLSCNFYLVFIKNLAEIHLYNGLFSKPIGLPVNRWKKKWYRFYDSTKLLKVWNQGVLVPIWSILFGLTWFIGPCLWQYMVTNLLQGWFWRYLFLLAALFLFILPPCSFYPKLFYLLCNPMARWSIFKLDY